MKHIPSKCPLCGGNVESGKTVFTIDLTSGVVVMRDVPAFICNQCGEEWLEDAIAKKLEIITARARSQNTQIEVLAMA
ncbi:MAG TPA: type II toxin-antitoxin system MqsA family antitoxin [Saprospiraceae bacterium]|nr:type II toxin-antitoxin system MqsA family antitoxin [Saprospiraceae bacterium]HND87433.1 type II toxin-antitoxin system MqsA family antitoxin [Saprospiraceae bacterium]HNG90140.1 type II toxin-antitoxin system MqsA family antitoxin [Saprospiraceae bacterium]